MGCGCLDPRRHDGGAFAARVEFSWARRGDRLGMARGWWWGWTWPIVVAAAAVSLDLGLAMATTTSGPDSTMVVASSPSPRRMARWRVLVAALVAADLGIPFPGSSQDARGGRSFLRRRRRWMLDRGGCYHCMGNDSGWRDGGCSL